MELIPAIQSRIYLIRGHKVMLDADLAQLYDVTTKALNQAVRRNHRRFPADFMFQLTSDERTEVVTNCDHLARLRFSHALPLAFTEQGVSMLSSVLKSERAIEVNITIMRVFARLKGLMIRREDLATTLKELETRVDIQDAKILAILNAIGELVDPKKPRPKIGFKTKG